MAEFGELRLVWLEAFVKVAETGKRTAAAEEMGIHQGTVTKHIQKLEHWLGRRLIVHDSVPARLWSEQDDFFDLAKQVVELLKDARVPEELSVEAHRQEAAPKAPPRRPPPSFSIKDLKGHLRAETSEDS
ncbi:helix-turn-helix domain-containing protein [Caulobacter radicis]|uniref:HTH lysR-type domain-containing protein n=1 Tax=Caulobacter radicis TaxID=2172650 RepID=A0A2T9J5Y6_9CAUL|nr:LysR family transcriptional regulator [Caulobacter radicis]PVM76381.1 hypothetical protein DDF65_17815 [Caulobacter radicis]